MSMHASSQVHLQTLIIRKCNWSTISTSTRREWQSWNFKNNISIWWGAKFHYKFSHSNFLCQILQLKLSVLKTGPTWSTKSFLDTVSLNLLLSSRYLYISFLISSKIFTKRSLVFSCFPKKSNKASRILKKYIPKADFMPKHWNGNIRPSTTNSWNLFLIYFQKFKAHFVGVISAIQRPEMLVATASSKISRKKRIITLHLYLRQGAGNFFVKLHVGF